MKYFFFLSFSSHGFYRVGRIYRTNKHGKSEKMSILTWIKDSALQLLKKPHCVVVTKIQAQARLESGGGLLTLSTTSDR